MSASYIFGIFMALTSGIVNNLGNLLQKKAINSYLQEQMTQMQIEMGDVPIAKLSNIDMSMKTLVTRKVWLFGFIMQLLVATALFIVSQQYIGASLTPALGSIGLVVIVFASCLLQEKLTWWEYLGIVLMTGAVMLLAFSDMSIDAAKTDFLDPYFIMRCGIYTGVCIIASAFCKIWAWKKDKHEGICLATLSGLLISLSNFWIAPFISFIAPLLNAHHRIGNPTFENHHMVSVVFFWLIAGILVAVSNVQAIVERQLAFRVGNAATMIPISHVPSHISSPVLFSLVFYLSAPKVYSLGFMWGGIVLLLVASFIFGKREAQMEKKQASRLAEGELTAPLVGGSQELRLSTDMRGSGGGRGSAVLVSPAELRNSRNNMSPELRSSNSGHREMRQSREGLLDGGSPKLYTV
eukprot:TRINITY_DN1671_c0_g1_i1.p1 TRINITY_DN1671_c0_g1~~TRINITY_DN1671_c0_g1_i1.p1  ORF type:complete len:409 (-),score=97.73 TRINITY_DN1671_c0_g1_i1:374-1600(-)